MGGSRWWGLLKVHRGKLGLVAVIILCNVFLNLTPPLFIKGIIDDALGGHRLLLLVELVAGLVGVSFLSSLVGVGQNYVLTWISVSVTAELQRRLFVSIQKGSARFHDEMKPGDLMARFQNDATGIERINNQVLPNVLSSVLTGAGALVVLLAMDWKLVGICAVMYVLYFIPMRKFGKSRRAFSQQRQLKNGEMFDWMQQSFEGVRLVKTFAAERAALKRYKNHLKDVFQLDLKGNMTWRLVNLWTAILSSVGPALAFWYGGHQIFNGEITLGTLIAFNSYLPRLFGVMQAISFGYIRFKEVGPMLDRIEEVVRRAEEEHDPTGQVQLTSAAGRIEFQDVRFAYRPDIPILQGISFSIQPGQKAAFVGPTGSGKSTVLALLLRLYDPTAGEVWVDGINLKEVDPKTWRKQVAHVPQEPFLFNDSLRANLSYGEQVDQHQMEEAAKQAAIHDFVQGLQEAYDSHVGERGVQLSGGQRQRIVLARALLRNPKVLLLDEATSALDNENETAVQLALGEWSRGRTTVVIAHRLSTVVDCDVIYVLERGRIVEQGTHQQLLANGGLYARLALAQQVAGKEMAQSGS